MYSASGSASAEGPSLPISRESAHASSRAPWTTQGDRRSRESCARQASGRGLPNRVCDENLGCSSALLGGGVANARTPRRAPPTTSSWEGGSKILCTEKNSFEFRLLCKFMKPLLPGARGRPSPCPSSACLLPRARGHLRIFRAWVGLGLPVRTAALSPGLRPHGSAPRAFSETALTSAPAALRGRGLSPRPRGGRTRDAG